ncbi:MAG: DUF3667 domain-containing protein [Bacteroidales bacterium]|nr:DUF3667 domain-containing protein [Bacteroidales bacterium]
MKLPEKLTKWLRPRLRLWKMYNELGYIPWHKPRKEKKKKERKGVYIGTREAIPFMNDDAKRTLSHLLLRPGYMMRDYIMRGQHERYLAPFTALLVFYSVFTLIVAIVKPGTSKNTMIDSLINGFNDATAEIDEPSAKRDSLTISFDGKSVKSIDGGSLKSMVKIMRDAVLLTRLDLYPEAADTPWKESLAAVESDLRGKGIPLFLGNFLLIWLTMIIVLKKYKISASGTAAASAYVLCQFCIFMFLALLFSLGRDTSLGLLLMGILLFIDYRQMLQLDNKKAFWLTVKTGWYYLILLVAFYVLIGSILITYAAFKAL